jgi:tRNA G26 N,N-dimethylase Trm1
LSRERLEILAIVSESYVRIYLFSEPSAQEQKKRYRKNAHAYVNPECHKRSFQVKWLPDLTLRMSCQRQNQNDFLPM